MHKCRACESEELELIIDFSPQPLAGGFLTKDRIPDEQIRQKHPEYDGVLVLPAPEMRFL
jgi:hypothetical protein